MYISAPFILSPTLLNCPTFWPEDGCWHHLWMTSASMSSLLWNNDTSYLNSTENFIHLPLTSPLESHILCSPCWSTFHWTLRPIPPSLSRDYESPWWRGTEWRQSPGVHLLWTVLIYSGPTPWLSLNPTSVQDHRLFLNLQIWGAGLVWLLFVLLYIKSEGEI